MKAFDKLQASIFGGVSQSKLNILQNEIASVANVVKDYGSRIGGSITAAYENFRDRIIAKHDELFNDRRLREVRDYLASGNVSIEDGFIHRLNRSHFVLNNDTKRFILAHPTVYRMHNEGILDEFGGHNEIDRSVSIPEFMTEYIETYDGIVRNIEGTKGEVSLYESTTEIKQLSFPEVCVRMDVWDTVSEMLLDGLDPTQEDTY